MHIVAPPNAKDNREEVEENVEALSESICVDGLAEDYSGLMVIRPDKGRPGRYFVLTAGHRSRAVYRSASAL